MTEKESTRDLGMAVPKKARAAYDPRRFYALVIGIDAYAEWEPLKCARADAEYFRRTLVECCGFVGQDPHMRELYDGAATRAGILDGLRELAGRLGKEDSLVVYYAGHGHMDELKCGYWVPVEARKGAVSDLVGHEEVKAIIRKAKAKHVTLISDSCFGGLLAQRGEAPVAEVPPGYYSQAFSLPGRMVLTSGNEEPVGDEEAQGHSLFNFKLCRYLEYGPRKVWTPKTLHGRLVEELGGGTMARCERLEGDRGGDEGGEFVFCRVKAVGGGGFEAAVAEEESDEAVKGYEVQEYEVEPIVVEIERVEVEEKEVAGLPSMSDELVRVMGEVEGLRRAIGELEAGTHRSLSEGKRSVEQAKTQYEALMRHVEEHAGGMTAKDFDDVVKEFARNPEASIAGTMGRKPRGMGDRDYTMLVLRCRHAGRGLRALQETERAYKGAVEREVGRLRRELEPREKRLLALQEADFGRVLEAVFRRAGARTEFPGDEFLQVAEEVRSRGYAWEWRDLWERAEKGWGEWRAAEAARAASEHREREQRRREQEARAAHVKAMAEGRLAYKRGDLNAAARAASEALLRIPDSGEAQDLQRAVLRRQRRRRVTASAIVFAVVVAALFGVVLLTFKWAWDHTWWWALIGVAVTGIVLGTMRLTPRRWRWAKIAGAVLLVATGLGPFVGRGPLEAPIIREREEREAQERREREEREAQEGREREVRETAAIREREQREAEFIRQLEASVVVIPGGTFTMGSSSGEWWLNRDETQHSVRISSFCMGKYEVTQEEYEAVMGKNPSKFKGARRPVEQVSWHEAVEFCNRLSEREGLQPAYRVSGENVTWDQGADGYRLPSEAEWEYACRAGTNSAFYTGGCGRGLGIEPALDRAGWYKENSGWRPHDVGQKEPNAWGLYDMHGNVYEWCWDWYGPYEKGSLSDPTGPSSGSGRVIRGGDFQNHAWVSRSACRGKATPNDRWYSLGFRLARSGAAERQ